MNRRRATTVMFASLLGLGAGCARDPALVPAAGATLVPGRPGLAVEAEAGIRVYVHGDAWQGDPSDLERVMTPVRVTIENRSGQRIRIQYGSFKLTGSSGLQYEPIPPFKISRPGPVRSQPAYPPPIFYSNFYVAPYMSPFWPGMTAWPHAFPFDSTYYGRLYVTWREPLPTEDMLKKALPEGVLEPRGLVSGFLYFDKVTDREPGVTLSARFGEAEQGTELASFSVPLRVLK